MRFIDKIWRSFIKLLSPSSSVGGLEISDTSLRFLEFIGDEPHYASLRLPPGIIESGKIKDRENFIEALRALHGQIASSPKNTVNVIVTIPANDVYVQGLGITKVAEADLAEAADLNLRMISPIDINTAYYSWQRIGSNGVDHDGQSQIELLGAFITKNIVDEFVASIQEAGYSIAAVEFSTLSIARNIFAAKLLKYDAPYLAIQINSSGLYFMVLRNRSLAFNYFAPWSTAQGEERAISVESSINLAIAETQRIFNFYSSHWGGQIKNAAIIGSVLSAELGAAINSRFPGVEVETIGPDAATSVQGAAIRGLIPRSQDIEISLTNVSVHQAFQGEQVLKFISLWRSITITVFATLLLLFVGADIYLRNISASVTSGIGASVKQPEVKELADLKAQADNFNRLVDIATKAKASERKIAWLVDKIEKAAADTGVNIVRIYIQSPDNPLLVVAQSSDQQSSVSFKNKLAAIPQLSQVNLPLSSISIGQNNSVNFTITFTVSSWNP